LSAEAHADRALTSTPLAEPAEKSAVSSQYLDSSMSGRDPVLVGDGDRPPLFSSSSATSMKPPEIRHQASAWSPSGWVHPRHAGGQEQLDQVALPWSAAPTNWSASSDWG
jgi:hypothetical protein